MIRNVTTPPTWLSSQSTHVFEGELVEQEIVFVLGGIYVSIEETLEDTLCAELVSEAQHGMAFGMVATVNGIGDFASSVVVGLLWATFGTAVAFGYSAALFLAGSLLVARLRV